MADNFFGFDTDFSSELGVLGKPALDDELLTDDVEEEYDALNDETFGQAANDDWEEAHEKLSELIKSKVDLKSYFNDSLLENDDSQQEIVSQSISQLGLEDDIDDPAIMTISRSCPSNRLRSVFGPSPPPPAFLETELCGSPKTHSIWSTTSKDSGISFLKSLSHSPSSLSQKDPHNSSNSVDSVFISPHKAWHAEELERNLLSSSEKEKETHASSSKWPSTSTISSSSQNLSSKSPQKFPNLNHNQNKVNQRMLTREEVERHLHSDLRVGFPNKVASFPQPPLPPPHVIHPNIIPPIGSPASNNLNATLHSPIVPLRLRGPMMGGTLEHPFVPFPNPRNLLPNQIPRPDYMLPNHPMRNMLSQYLGLTSRPINHPLMQTQWKPFLMFEKQDAENYRNGMYQVDEYAGLMTQREKEWLIRIQMLLLKSENPYVEDYYYTTQQARKLKKIYSENFRKNKGDAPEVILPETSKSENKIYVPTQFEGSLGKLQAVSVNFPRKVLDIKVTRPLEDDEGQVVTNQSLRKYRRLLLDIEKLYTYFLEIEDEEKRILAKPDSGEAPHRLNIAKLTLKIYNGLCSENSPDENFQNIMTIRKGRNILIRSFSLFNKEQQVQCLIHLCRCLPFILKKDQNDLVFVKNYKIIIESIQSFSLLDLIHLSEALETGSSESSKDRNSLTAALKNKFGMTVICCMVNKAENLYSECNLLEKDLQDRWVKTMLHFTDVICNTENMLALPLMPSSCLLDHFQRFVIDRDKFEILKQKLKPLETDSVQEAQNSV